jgi:hypothetical protein
VGLEVTDPEQVAVKLSEYIQKLSSLNQRESQLRVATEALAVCRAGKVEIGFTITAMGNLSSTLEQMSRYQEAESFAREMVVTLETEWPTRGIHAAAVQRLSQVGLLFRHFFLWSVEVFQKNLCILEPDLCL